MKSKRTREGTRLSSEHKTKSKEAREFHGKIKVASNPGKATEHLLDTARRRGQELAKEFLDAEGGILTQREVGKILGLSARQVEEQRASGSLLAVPKAKEVYFYPCWQFKENGTLPGLAEVLTELRGHDSWAQLGFFLSGNYRFGGATPLDELRRGNIEGVCRAARMYGEHGAA